MDKTVFQKMTNNNNPEYSKYMYLDGYKPEEILSALHQKMINDQADDDDEPDEMTIKTVVEVRK